MEAMTESYQLKWHAFGTHLHSCVAASMSTRLFTDVCLVTMDGCQIAAHRFILSACSQYLHDVLKMHQKAITSTLAPMLIVLPPEISNKSLKVLIEYMYSGYATVSKDILENVLRGGDLLKVKGLWRPKEDEQEPRIRVKPSDKLQQLNATTAQPSPVPEKKLVQTRSIPSTSKIISIAAPGGAAGVKTTSGMCLKKSGGGHHASVIISTDKALSQSTSKESQIVAKKVTATDVVDRIPPRNVISVGAGSSSNNSVTSSCRKNLLEVDEDGDQPKLVIKEEPIEWTEISEHEMEVIHGGDLYTTTTITNNDTTEMTIKPEILFDGDDDEDEDLQQAILASTLGMHPEGGAPPPPLVPIGGDQRPRMASASTSAVDGEGEGEAEAGGLYTPLMCELCSETFTLPRDWVKHVQTHTDMMPAKRQRRGRNSSEDESSNTFPPLQCDLCQTYFPTPAEWVHHIESSHTDTELRISNYDKTISGASGGHSTTAVKITKDYVKPPTAPSSVTIIPGQSKECPVCNKSFPSHASMMIHSRTHTGERPYNCDYCCKGFNVKSNLLRHLRTLHDKIINSTDIENKDVDNEFP